MDRPLFGSQSDDELIALYNSRSERALAETERKYGSFLSRLAFYVLQNEEDCKECVNDTLLAAWNHIPPERPQNVRAYLAVIVRRIALERYEKQNAAKRQANRRAAPIDDFSEILSGDRTLEEEYENALLKEAIDRYLSSCPARRRYVFIARFCYSYPLEEIADRLSVSLSTVNKEIRKIKTELHSALVKGGFSL